MRIAWWPERRVRTAFRRLGLFAKGKRGNMAVITALISPVFVATMGLGAEGSYWYSLQRGMQNAADAAVIAAAANGTSSYADEAQAVAARMGYPNGVNNIVVTTSEAATCLSGAACYTVTVSEVVPVYLGQLIGYKGDTTLNGSPAVQISATARSVQGTVARNYCLLALGSSGNAIQGNGVPAANFSGCNIMSDASARCTGHNMGADFGDAHLTDSGCGVAQDSGLPIVSDPYSALKSNIPANPCSSYPQEPGKNGTPLPAGNLWSGSITLPSTYFVCGDLQLTGNTTITSASGGSILVIENGQLDTGTGCYTLATASGSALTIIFSGTSGSYTHAPTGCGTLNIQAPPSGTWSGVALYQDPSLTTGVDIASAGNSPTWDITGLVYLPNSNVTFKGAVNKSSYGASCFVMVAYTVYVAGTGAIFETGGCDAAGLSMPTNVVAGRGALID
jgi:Flp pilus assembly protein TadG